MLLSIALKRTMNKQKASGDHFFTKKIVNMV